VPQNDGTTLLAPPIPPPPSYARPSSTGPEQRTNSTAIVAFVFAFLLWPVGIILGHIARRSIRRTGEGGAGLALAALIISYVWGAILIVIVVAALAAPSASGFNNLTTLQTSVTQQLNKNLSDPSSAAYSPGASITSVICVHSSGTQYSCFVKASDGSSTSLSVTVSSDGSRWVTN
jgi:ABC-type dipeptide/oligopeptide/nickel transport system permease component